MCSRYALRHAPEDLRDLFLYRDEPQFPPREKINPSEPIAVVRAGVDRQPEFALLRWNFVPSWAKEVVPGRPLVNARAETVYEKASFKNAIRRRRCLVPADGFYEWQGDVPGKKQPWFIHRPDDALFAFGGIWEHWLGADGSELETAAILTTTPSLPLAAIHERSPVVIAPEDFERWLSADEQVQDLLKPPPDDFWTMEKIAPTRPAPPAPPKPTNQMDLF